ncbi:NACHT domain-containing protein [Saccharopolyspora flava]|nr:hypothetical protein [Saccharopolyspora flava]
MAEESKIHNESSGPARNNIQIGINYGKVSVGAVGPLDFDEVHDRLLHVLARSVAKASKDELARWELGGSDVLSVRWSAADDGLVDHPDKIQSDGTPGQLDGEFGSIRQTFESVESQRLVILGRAGAGKTVLARRLILDLIAERRAPVPVLFSLGGWDPEVRLKGWLEGRLVRDHPILGAEDVARRSMAQHLLDRGSILPVLDGFDEIPESRRKRAIRQISSLDLPFVFTSRPSEYSRAAREARPISRAAAIKIHELASGEAERYLSSSTAVGRSPGWAEVFKALNGVPAGSEKPALAHVLTSPLNVTLARAIYNDGGREPKELLERFHTVGEIEEHLWSSYLSIAYLRDGGPRDEGWDPDLAREWLGSLAEGLVRRGTLDLMWWSLPASLYRGTRVLVFAVVVSLAVGSAGLVFLSDGVLFAIGGGLAVGLAGGLVNEKRFPRGGPVRGPERLRLRMRWKPSKSAPRSGQRQGAPDFADGFQFGLLNGLGLTILSLAMGVPSFGILNYYMLEPEFGVALDPVHSAVDGILAGLFVGGISGLVFGIGNFLVAIFGEGNDSHEIDSWDFLKIDRAVALVRAAGAFLAFGITYGAVSIPVLGVLPGAALALVNGFCIGVVRLAISPWGNWILFTRLWLPLTGRMAWRPRKFLEHAYERQVLRRTGAVFQFRHSRLQDHLADRG